MYSALLIMPMISRTIIYARSELSSSLFFASFLPLFTYSAYVYIFVYSEEAHVHLLHIWFPRVYAAFPKRKQSVCDWLLELERARVVHLCSPSGMYERACGGDYIRKCRTRSSSCTRRRRARKRIARCAPEISKRSKRMTWEIFAIR